MKGKQFVKAHKRQLMTVLALTVVIYVFAGVGIFSYYQSKDNVTNRISSNNGSVTIYEPRWDSVGQYKAQKSEPGMRIEKDPYAKNDGQIDLYVRLKMTISLGDYEGNLMDNVNSDIGEVGVPSDLKRFREIIKAIKLEDNTQFITLNDSSENVGEWTVESPTVSGGNFIPGSIDYNGSTLTICFYYTKSDPGGEMYRLKPEEWTTKLFDHLDIPIYKKDYLGVFDQAYSITVQAEGIPADNYNSLAASDAASEFND